MANGDKERAVFSQRIQTSTVALLESWHADLVAAAHQEGHQEPERGFATDLAIQLGIAAYRAGWRIKNGLPCPPSESADTEAK